MSAGIHLYWPLGMTSTAGALPSDLAHYNLQDAEEGTKAALSSASMKDKEVVQMEAQLQQHR